MEPLSRAALRPKVSRCPRELLRWITIVPTEIVRADEWLHTFPILLVDDWSAMKTATGRATRALVDRLREGGTPVITAIDAVAAEMAIAGTTSRAPW